MTTQEVPRPSLVGSAPVVRATAIRRDRLVVGSLTLLALALRAPNLGRAYWIDEGISIGISSHHLDQLPKLLSEDGSPPLFYVLLHFWIGWFGTGEVATHMLPFLISLAGVPLGYWAGRELFNRRAGLAAAALLATNPFLGWYSTETRMYPLVVVLTIVGITFAWRAVRDKRMRDGVGAVLAFAALLYTHDWGIYITAVTAAVLFVLALTRRDRRLAVTVAVGGMATLILWLPWLPTFLSQASNTAAPWAIRPGIGDFFADPSSALGGTLGMIVAPALALGAVWTRRQRLAEYGSVAGWLGAIGLLSALAGWLGAQLEPSWTERYLAIIVAPFLLAAAGALGTSKRGMMIVISVSVILTGWTVTGFLLPNSNSRYAKSNVAAVAAAVAAKLRPGDVVVVTQTEQLAVLDHYLPRGLIYLTPTGPVADPEVVDWKNIVARLNLAEPCDDLAPTIDRAPVGVDVLEIDPARTLGASGTAWARAVNYQVFRDDTYLAQDPGLRAIGLYNPASEPKPYSPVDAVLFRKTSTQSACS